MTVNIIGRCGARAREAVERECVCEGGSGYVNLRNLVFSCACSAHYSVPPAALSLNLAFLLSSVSLRPHSGQRSA